MTAEEALDLYKSRDGSEKLFRGDKSYLGNKSFCVHSSESVANKIFIEFVALIILNKFYVYLVELANLMKKKQELQGKELLNAFMSSDKSLNEILEFMNVKSENEE